MRLFAVLTFVLLAGCTHAPASFRSLTPTTMPALHDCAMRKLSQLSYTVTDSTGDGRSITGEKDIHKSAVQAFTQIKYYDRLVVSIVDTDSASRTMRITASSLMMKGHLFRDAVESSKATSDNVQVDAGTVLTACAGGVVTKEGAGAR